MANEIAKIIEDTQDRFVSIAPPHMNYDAEKGFAIQLLKNNDYLMKAANESPNSLQQAITNVAAIGLSLNPAEKLAYLIPRNVKEGKDQSGRDVWKTKIYLEPSYMGIIRLATDSGSIKWVQAYCVYKKDDFIDNGPGEKPKHLYNAFASLEERGAFKGVYCTAKTENDYLTTIMPAEKVYDIRGRSEAFKKWGSGPWKTDFQEMAKKAVIRQAFKTWPRTDERRMQALANAVDISNDNEGIELFTSPEITKNTAGQKEYFDQLISNSDAIGMFVFMESLDIPVRTSLNNSFEKGSIGKYKALVGELMNSGREIIKGCQDDLMNAAQGNDPDGALQVIEDLSDDELKAVLNGLDGEVILFVDSLEKSA